MRNRELQQHAVRYAEIYQISLNLKNPLGYGSDGTVWESDRRTAVKVIERQKTYAVELECYRRLRAKQIRDIQGFAVPQLIGNEDSLQVIEMKIVSPPYILDFGKVELDHLPEFTRDKWEYYYAEMKERFEGDYKRVRTLLAALVGLCGIHYMDPKPGNIVCHAASEN